MVYIRTHFTKYPIDFWKLGIIHGDAHPENWTILTVGSYQFSYSGIDWVISDKNFNLVDFGTIVWYANISLEYFGKTVRLILTIRSSLKNSRAGSLRAMAGLLILIKSLLAVLTEVNLRTSSTNPSFDHNSWNRG